MWCVFETVDYKFYDVVVVKWCNVSMDCKVMCFRTYGLQVISLVAITHRFNAYCFSN